jgi:hypothetical protein
MVHDSTAFQQISTFYPTFGKDPSFGHSEFQQLVDYRKT